MGYERFMFWFWKSTTTDACKVKKTLSSSYMLLFLPYLLNDSQTIRSTINVSNPLLCETLICCDWLISSPVMPDKAAFVSAVLLVYSVTGKPLFLPLQAENELAFSFWPTRKDQQVGQVNTKRLGFF